MPTIGYSRRPVALGRRGMVASAHPYATVAGLDVLRAGGNCVDAAIATNAALGLMEPAMCGIGGDLFAILWHEKDRRLYGLNASGRAPAAWSLDRAGERVPRRRRGHAGGLHV